MDITNKSVFMKGIQKKYSYIFVILVYRNYEDLQECIKSIYLNVHDCRIVVVNSFYDDLSKQKIQTTAIENNCDFLNVENKGYSFGNNKGISYARENYDYDYIVVSNPDIVIKQFDDVNIGSFDIIAPKIIAANGKLQNPMMVKENKLSKMLIYYGFKWNILIFFYIGVLINKFYRFCYVCIHRKQPFFKIYEAHGSFVLLKKRVVDSLFPIYDENMFLFAEEDVLAHKAKKAGFSIFYVNDIVIHHKEDGSMKLANFSINNELKKSNLYFYEKYIKEKK